MHHLPGLDRDLADLPDDEWERGWLAAVAGMLRDESTAAILRVLAQVRDRYRRMAAQRHQGGPIDRVRLCRARLCPWQVRVIRRLGRTVSDREAAMCFGVAQSTVSRIRSGTSWYWLDGPQPAA